MIVELERIGTDPARARAGSERLIAHYNATWLGEDYPVDTTMTGYQAPPLDGIWATAPYLHNGSVPTLALLLKSTDRPRRFTRPPSTDFAHYDQVNVGWKFEPVAAPPSPLCRRSRPASSSIPRTSASAMAAIPSATS